LKNGITAKGQTGGSTLGEVRQATGIERTNEGHERTGSAQITETHDWKKGKNQAKKNGGGTSQQREGTNALRELFVKR